ncbi:MAG: EamA family transporter [Alphaproteobacteria bacterium]
METHVLLLVLCGAVLHASWNAIVKGSSDKLLDLTQTAVWSGILAAIALPFFPPPSWEAWPYMVASTVVHFFYFLLVAGAYKFGDLTLAYPIMRGTGPLLVALLSGPLIGENLTPFAWLGVGLVCCAIFTLGVDGWRRGKAARAGIGFALLNAAVIASYTLLDGLGARISGDGISYMLWLSVFDAFPVGLFVLYRWRRPVLAHARKRWRFGIAGGGAMVGSYGIALWAMTVAPIASVAALRESSVIFATVLGALFLKEKFGWSRVAAAAAMVGGAVALRLG